MKTFLRSATRYVPTLALLVLPPVAEGQTPFNDANWVPLNHGGTSGEIEAVCAVAVDGSGCAYAGGYFYSLGTVPRYDIARWDGLDWSALGSGIAGAGEGGKITGVYALATSGAELYVGGCFTTAGGLPATNIARWDGKYWSGLGLGVNADVSALAVNTGDLYAGGDFTVAGGVAANRIGKWNGSTWSALGEGMNSNVFALCVCGTNLYAGGAFTTAGGVPAGGIARWDGRRWSALGSGVSGAGRIFALAASGTTVYAGGVFVTMDGVSATNIAKWDGNAWSAVGSGVGIENYSVRRIYALVATGTDLYAGGTFLTAGSVSANRMAKWDGSNWSALGSGVSGGWWGSEVRALASDGAGRLIVGGIFWTAGTNGSTLVAAANIGAVPGRLTDCLYLPSSGFNCTFREGTFGYPYRIQASPSLASAAWVDLTNFTYSGPITITDGAGGTECKFYRAASP